jgi:hypothetical protein
MAIRCPGPTATVCQPAGARVEAAVTGAGALARLSVVLGGWRSDGAGSVLVVVPVLVALLLCLLPAGRGNRAAAAALLPLGVLWLLFNGRLEGPILLSFDRRHGVTLSDLLAVVGFAVAARTLARHPRRCPTGAG